MTISKNIQSKDSRVAIIGAGIAGLTAAYTLKKLGYENITIFEAQDRVGGKIISKKVDDAWYELGAIYMIDGYRIVPDMAKHYNVSLSKQRSFSTFYENGKPQSPIKLVRKNYSYFKIAKAMVSFVKLASRNKNLKIPGFSGADSELYKDYKTLCKENNIDPFYSIFETMANAYGYGAPDTTPALYYVKLLMNGLSFLAKDMLNSTFGLRLGTIFTFDCGYQTFLERIADDFDVRLSSGVTGVVREITAEGYKVQVTTGEETETFDKIIISSMPIHTLRYLDADSTEHDIFSRVKYVNYHEIMFYCDMPFTEDAVFLEQESDGDPACLVKLHTDKNIFQSYHMHNGVLDDEALEARLNEAVLSVGGKIGEKIIKMNFTFFPHFQEKELRELGPYERLEKMQGDKGTYYIGSLFNMEGSELSAVYAKHLVEKFF